MALIDDSMPEDHSFDVVGNACQLSSQKQTLTSSLIRAFNQCPDFSLHHGFCRALLNYKEKRLGRVILATKSFLQVIGKYQS